MVYIGHYRTAQICLNGHVITDAADAYPEFKTKFCIDCGEKTIMNCTKCNERILGEYYVENYLGSSDYTAPAYCHNCGNPYPWTQSALDATQELLSLENKLSTEELTYLSENMSSLIADTPKTKVVATKLKLAISKLGPATSSAIRDIVVDIASEAAKKIIFPQ